MSEINIRLDVEYDGTEYSGWQIQPNVTTIQGEIQSAIRKVTGQEVVIYGAGRTDAGVHAFGQVCNFFIDGKLEPEKYSGAINYYLPNTILITRSSQVGDNFNARRSALWRHYRYLIGRVKSALYLNRRWEYLYPLDINRMNIIASYLSGIKDCSAFCTVSSLQENNDCDIIMAEWQDKDDFIQFDIKANRFLHSMVRSIVGLMVEAGKTNDYLTLENFKDIMESGDHTRINKVAPARGLYLVAVGY